MDLYGLAHQTTEYLSLTEKALKDLKSRKKSVPQTLISPKLEPIRTF